MAWPRRLVKIRAGQRGSGWALGATGVVTCWHVIADYCANPAGPANPDGQRLRLVVADGTDEVIFDGELVWCDQELELAVLRVVGEQETAWRQRLVDAPPAVLAATGDDPSSGAQVIGFPVVSYVEEAKRPDPEQLAGTLLPVSGVLGRLAFDVATTVAVDELLWRGISGGAVRDVDDRLLGLVTQSLPDRERRRFHVSPFPAVDESPDFFGALAQVGAAAYLDAADAPLARQWLTLLRPDGTAPRLSQTQSLSELGVRRARNDVATMDQPYFGYIGRPESDELRAAIRSALPAGGASGARMILLTGESAAGKSRLLAEVARGLPELADYRVVRPHYDRDFTALPPPWRSGRCLIWLDDLHRYPLSGLTAAKITAATDDGPIILATIRRDELQRLISKDFRSGLGELLDLPDVIRVIEVAADPSWRLSADDVAARHALASAEANGVGLGEYLAAYQELKARYQQADVWAAELIDAVADWARCGLQVPLAPETARQLWLERLPTKNRLRYDEAVDADRDGFFDAALTYATVTALGSSSLIRRVRAGLRPTDIAQLIRGSAPIAPTIWSAAEARVSDLDEDQLLVLAFNAAHGGQPELAERLWRSREDSAPVAAFNLAVVLGRRGENDEAITRYHRAIESGDPETAPMAMVNLGVVLANLGRLDEAERVDRAALASGHPVHAPAAALNLANVLKKKPDWSGVEAAYRLAVASGHAQYSPMAAVALASVLQGQQRYAEAEVEFRYAMEHGDAEYRSVAAMQLAMQQQDLGHPAQARQCYDFAIAAGHPHFGPLSAFQLGELLLHNGDPAGARPYLQQAADADDEIAPRAAYFLGLAYAAENDLAEAERWYRVAVASEDRQEAPRAAFALAVLLQGQQHYEQARDAYRLAATSPDPGQVGPAAYALGMLSLYVGQQEEGLAALRRAAASDDPAFADKARFTLEGMGFPPDSAQPD